MKRSIYCCYTPVEPHQHPRHYHFAFQFSYNFFFNIYSFFKKYLHFLQHFYIPYLFISPLPFTLLFHLPTTLYLNITLRLSLHLPFFFCPFLFTTFYYKLVADPRIARDKFFFRVILLNIFGVISNDTLPFCLY